MAANRTSSKGRGGKNGAQNKFLHHVTFVTNSWRKSPRGEVDDSILRFVHDWLGCCCLYLADVLNTVFSCHIPIPRQPEYTAVVTRDDQLLVVNILYQNIPGVRFGIAPGGSAGAQLWAGLGGQQPVPNGPWCGVELLQTCVFWPPGQVARLDAFERYVAWAWLEMLESGHVAPASSPLAGVHV